MFNLRLKIIMITILMICNSCMKNDQEPPMLGIDIPIQEMNTKIKIYQLMEDSIFYKNDKHFMLGVKNLSSNSIAFENDLNVAIFCKEKGNWVIVENNIEYASGKRLLKTNGVDPTGLIMGIQPNIPALQSPTKIRVVIIGHEMDNPSAKPVGAFIDVTLNP
jgi:hypothetical protein